MKLFQGVSRVSIMSPPPSTCHFPIPLTVGLIYPFTFFFLFTLCYVFLFFSSLFLFFFYFYYKGNACTKDVNHGWRVLRGRTDVNSSRNRNMDNNQRTICYHSRTLYHFDTFFFSLLFSRNFLEIIKSLFLLEKFNLFNFKMIEIFFFSYIAQVWWRCLDESQNFSKF